MPAKIHLGISTCPNDTFAFHALMNGKVNRKGIEFDFELLDVQQLNDRLLQGEFDVAKASFHAALGLTRQTVVLSAGSALGFGNGPLLLSRHPESTPGNWSESTFNHGLPVVLCPGSTTTATLLYRMFFPHACEIRQVVFSEIMPALNSAAADFGVCIHEGRFTWEQKGLFRIADLGELWFQKTQSPLPLGGILGRRKLGDELLTQVNDMIRESIQYGKANSSETLPTMRKYAAEFSDEVLMSHVDLYVNENTIDLGETGRHALEHLNDLALTVQEDGETQPFGRLDVLG